MKKYSIILYLLFLLPIIAFGQQQVCDTLVLPSGSGADTVFYCYTNPSCYDTCDGSIIINVKGPNQPYLFSWDGSLTFVAGDNSRDSLCASQTIVSVAYTDINTGLDVLVDNSKVIDLISPPNFTIFLDSIKSPSCFGYNDGKIHISIGGATFPYIYSWEDGTNTDDRIGLDSGIYILETEDANGCIKLDTFELIDPLEVISQTITDTLSCIGLCDGSAIVVPQNGFSPYSFQWYDSNNNAIPGEVNDTSSSLCYGFNQVVLTDANGCLDTNEVFIENPDTLKVSNVIIDSSCYQICDGKITVDIVGGSAPYSYSWDNGDITQTADSLCPGTYELIYFDINDCSDTVQISITERDPFVLNDWIVNDSCYNSCKGEIKVSLLDKDKHSPPFIYDWSTGSSDTVISGLCSDTFSLLLIE